MSEFRKDPITNRWVIIAPERGPRPSDFITHRRAPNGTSCPFCPGREELTPRAIRTVLDREGKWLVRVIPNRYPALRVEEPLERGAEGLYDCIRGFGAHEIIVETPDHALSLWDLEEEERAAVLEIYRERFLDLGNDPRLRWAMIFKNRGGDAGATLRHEHSQLLALPLVPTDPQARWTGASAYFQQKERCVFCDMLSQEVKTGSRVVEESRSFLAFCPYASRSPFETWLVPKRHASHYASITQEEIWDLSGLLGRILRRLDEVLERPSLNFMLHTSPLQEETTGGVHWHLEISPAIQKFGGFEWGSGCFINPTAPEDAARFLLGREGP